MPTGKNDGRPQAEAVSRLGQRWSSLSLPGALEELLHEQGFYQTYTTFSRTQLINDLALRLGYSGEHVRKMLKGERTATRELLQELSRTFLVPIAYWREWRMIELTEQLKHQPELLDVLYEAAVAYAATRATAEEENEEEAAVH